LAPALVLASASPRRSQLLAPYVAFTVEPADIDESARPGEDPVAYVGRLAAEKARTARTARTATTARTAGSVPGAGRVVLAADTTVAVDGEILAKPADERDAARMLRALSDRCHVVHTGVAVGAAVGAAVGDGGVDRVGEVFVVSTNVRFAPLTDAMIDWYVATGEPLDKAGAYAIQGVGGAFVAAIDGSFSNVVGLPLAETLVALARAGVAVNGHTGR
jgi:septum formation protein